VRGARVCAVGFAIGSIALVLPVGSVAGASPSIQQRRSPRCTQGVTFRIVSPTVARTRIVNVRSANVRLLPGVDCPLITSVRRGTRLAGTGRLALVGRSRWVEVRGTFGTGWVALSLLR
jgi:hypothetical protein